MEEETVEQCACGAELKQFWLWRDGNGRLHASHFLPSVGLERAVMAASARDALLPISGGAPRHVVADVNDPALAWQGLCALPQ